MHPELEACCGALGLDVPTLSAAADRSEQWIADARGFFAGELGDVEPSVDVVFLGSIGRREASPESDLDYLVVAHSLIRHSAATVPRVMSEVERLRRELLELHEPGGTGVFGRLVAAPDLVERIGLDEDTNVHHTRRVLLLMESVSAFRDELHRDLIGAVLNRYLADYDKPKRGVPRFLLNDVMRYWRTMTVDYQAKKWGTARPEWGLRYLKLILSRKLMVAGTVASILRCEEATEEYFLEQFAMPPLARLAQLHHQLADAHKEDLKTVLSIADEFAAALEQETFREEAKAVTSRNDIVPGSAFDHFRGRAKEMQASLERIFYDDHLASRTRTYLSF